MVYDVCIISPPHFKQCAPNCENTGSIEQYCYSLANEFANQGKKVILWGTGNAQPTKKFTIKYYFDSHSENYYSLSPYEVTNKEVIHVAKCLQNIKAKYYLNHCINGIPLLEAKFGSSGIPYNTTLHWDLNEPRVSRYISAFPKHTYVAVSTHQGKLVKSRRLYHIHPGLELNYWHNEKNKSDFLLYLGRLTPGKSSDLAVRVAMKTNNKLMIAGRKMDERYPYYFNNNIRPYLSDKIQYLGEVCGKQKIDLLHKAKCTLCIGRWPEPAATVISESILAVTPVIAWNPKTSNEGIKHGVNGYIIKSTNEGGTIKKCINYLDKLNLLDIDSYYQNAREEHDISRSVKEYLKIYYEYNSLST